MKDIVCSECGSIEVIAYKDYMTSNIWFQNRKHLPPKLDDFEDGDMLEVDHTIHFICQRCDNEWGEIGDPEDYFDLAVKTEDSGLTPVWVEFEYEQVYVNVYAVTRHYGGPEEGGWWWDYHHPISSLLVDPDKEDPRRIQEELYRKYEDMREGDISSVLGGTDISVFIEDHFAKPYPEEKPHYE